MKLLSFKQFIAESLIKSTHYVDRIKDRVDHLQLVKLVAYKSDTLPALPADIKEAEFRLRYILRAVADTLHTINLFGKTPIVYYIVKFGKIVVIRNNAAYSPNISVLGSGTSMLDGNIFYAVTTNQKLTTLMTAAAGTSDAQLVDKSFAHIFRSNSGESDTPKNIDEFKSRSEVHSFLDKIEVNLDLSRDEFIKHVDTVYYKKNVSTETEHASAREQLHNAEIKLGFEGKHLYFTLGRKVKLMKGDTLVDRTVDTANKQGDGLIVKFKEKETVEIRGETKQVTSMKVYKKDQVVAVVPANVTQSDLVKIQSATNNKDLTLADIQNAVFIGKITDILYDKRTGHYIKISGTTVKL